MGPGVYSCKICGQVFKDPSNTRRHERTHLKLKPYLCPICGKGFSRNSHVTRHKTSCGLKHGIPSDSPQLSSVHALPAALPLASSTQQIRRGHVATRRTTHTAAKALEPLPTSRLSLPDRSFFPLLLLPSVLSSALATANSNNNNNSADKDKSAAIEYIDETRPVDLDTLCVLALAQNQMLLRPSLRTSSGPMTFVRLGLPCLSHVSMRTSLATRLAKEVTRHSSMSLSHSPPSSSLPSPSPLQPVVTPASTVAAAAAAAAISTISAAAVPLLTSRTPVVASAAVVCPPPRDAPSPASNTSPQTAVALVTAKHSTLLQCSATPSMSSSPPTSTALPLRTSNATPVPCC